MLDLCTNRPPSIEDRSIRPSRKTLYQQPPQSTPPDLLDSYSWLSRAIPRRQSSSTSSCNISLLLFPPKPDTGAIPPLLRLPIEIRTQIYRYILAPATANFKLYTDCDARCVNRKWNARHHPRRRKLDPRHAHSLALLRVNKAIYHESLSVLYSESTFHFIGSNYLPIIEFLRKLSEDAKRLVKKMRITMLPEAWHIKGQQTEVFYRTLIEWLPGLTSLVSDGSIRDGEGKVGGNREW